MNSDVNDAEELKKYLERCSRIRKVEESFIIQTLSSVKRNDFEKLENLFRIYIDTNQQFHELEGCPCEVKNIGKHFASLLGTQKSASGWTALHHAVNTNQKDIKKQALSAIIEQDPSLIWDKKHLNFKNETPLMIAALKNAAIVKILLDYMSDNCPSQLNAAVNFVNSVGDSALTYSFRFKRTNTNGSLDVSLVLVKLLQSIDLDTLIKAIEADNCPDEVVVELAQRLGDKVNETTRLGCLLRPLFQRKEIGATKFMNIINTAFSEDIKLVENMYSKSFNILQELAKIVDESTVKELFKIFYTTFLQCSKNTIHMAPDDQKNMAHFACIEGNLTLLKYLHEMDDLAVLLDCYDADNKRPTFYFRKPLTLLQHFQYEQHASLWKNLCKDNGYNIVHRALTRSYKDQFSILLQLEFSLLQDCDRNKDNVLHLMLQTRCDPRLLQQMTDKFKEKQLSVDGVNEKGMTPLFMLCSHIDKYEDEEDAIENITILVNAGADVNRILASSSHVTAQWLARMSVEHYAKEPEDFDLEEILKILRRTPNLASYDKEFAPDKTLCDDLRSLDIVKYSNQDFKLINLVGQYPERVFPGNCIVSKYTQLETLYYSSKLIRVNNTITYIHPDSVVWISVKDSLVVAVNSVDDQITRDSNNLDTQGLQRLSKNHISLLRFLKKRLGLTYLSCPSDLGDFSGLDDISTMPINESIANEFGCPVDLLSQNLHQLCELGFIIIGRLGDSEEYVLNLPSLLRAPREGKNRDLLSSVGIPTNSELATPNKYTQKCDIHLFNVSLYKGTVQYESALIFLPLVDMISYIIGVPPSMPSHTADQSGLDLRNHKSRLIALNNGVVEVRLEGKDIMFLSSDRKTKSNAFYVAELAVRHLNVSKVGHDDDIYEGKLDVKINFPDTGDEVTSVLLEKDTVEKPVNERKDTMLGNIVASRQRGLVRRVHEGRVELPVRIDSVRIKSEVAELEQARQLYALFREHANLTIQQFYHKHKQDEAYKPFSDVLLNVMELNEGHVRRKRDSCRANLWWIVTFIIAAIIAIVTVLLSVLYDVDAGFGGLAGVPAVIVASSLFKRICTRDEQGYIQDLDDDQVVSKCQNCFSAA